MNAWLLPNGHILIPKRATGPGGLVGDGMVEIDRTDPQYGEWRPFAKPIPHDMPLPRKVKP